MKMRAKNAPITQAEFLRRAGFSRSRFKVLVAEGLPLHGKKVDFAAASAWLEANVDPARQDRWQGTSLNDLRRQREEVRIETSKIELAKARGELVSRAEVKAAVSARARRERDSHIAWVARTAPQLASELGADPARTFAVVDRLMREHLLALAQTPLDLLTSD